MVRPILVALFSAATVAPAGAQLSFTDRTAPAGLDIDLAHSADHPAMIMDGGAAVGDFNRDGWPDVFVPSTGLYPDRLFINQQDGRFAEEGAAWGFGDLYRGCAVCVGDFDGNGYPDLYVTSMGDVPGAPVSGQNRLYRNEGNGSFTNVAASAGVGGDAIVPDGFGCTFGDYDLDGDLDLYVTGWVQLSLGNRLYRNEGNGTFTDVTQAAGVHQPYLRGFAPRFVDINMDRYPELFVAGDFGTSEVWANDGDGTFTNVTQMLQPDKVHYGMGSTFGDFDGDLWMDWYATSIYHDGNPLQVPNGNRLYYTRGNGYSCEAAPFSAGVDDGGWGWGTEAADFDHDGYLDIVETNGWNINEWMGERSYVFRNLGDGSFEEIGAASGMTHVGQGRCVATLDYDNDGDLDVLFTTNQDTLALYRNDLTGPASHWLRVELDTSAHPSLAPDGIGARVEVYGSVGGTAVQSCSYREPGQTYLGGSQLTTHFGLSAGSVVDEVHVLWPDGWRTVIEDVAVDQILQVSATPPLEVTPLVRGQSAEATLTGGWKGEQVFFVYGLRGEGPGPCLPELGGLCLDVRTPIWILGAARVDAEGVARLVLDVPVWMPPVEVTVQGYVSRGIAGEASAKTNPVTRRVQF